MNIEDRKRNEGKRKIEEREQILKIFNKKKKEINNYFALLHFKEKIEMKFEFKINSELDDYASEKTEELKKYFNEKIKEKNKEWDMQIERAKWKSIVQPHGEMKCKNGHDIDDNVFCGTCHGHLYWVDFDDNFAICKGCQNNVVQKLPKKIIFTCGEESLCTVKPPKGYKL